MPRLSSYLFQARTFVGSARQNEHSAALSAAREAEEDGSRYPQSVREAADEAYRVLQESAPEVAAEMGPPGRDR